MALPALIPDRTTDEISAAIEQFSEADWARLRMAATRYATNEYSPDDLLNEAVCRALIDDEDSPLGRVCPGDVSVPRFLAEAMKSIANASWRKADRRPDLVPVANQGDAIEGEVDIRDEALSPEQIVGAIEECGQMREQVLELFDDDPVAREIMEMRMAEFETRDIREAVKLDDTAYDSKCTLIRRRIAKRFPGGWRP